jgi:DMSO/TMAO reductase YedYZ molybdopterin-dependent catalytic subunit
MTDRDLRPSPGVLPSRDLRPSRRELLRLGLLAVPASLAAACGWDGGSRLAPAMRAFSRLNDWVGENVFLSDRHLAPQYRPSQRTLPVNFPTYALTHPFPPAPDGWALTVGGLVKRPQRLSLAAIQALPRITYTVKHHCVEGWTAIATWTGVPFASVVALAEPAAEARYVRFDTFDRGYSNGWDLASAMHPQTILAYGMNDRPLGSEHGAPLRLYSPTKLGYKLTKYLTAVTFTAERPGGYWEDRGYPWLGGV